MIHHSLVPVAVRATWVCLVLPLLIISIGCNSSTQPGSRNGSETDSLDSTEITELANPVGSLKLAIRSGRWDSAWEASEVILAEAGIDPGTDKPISLTELKGLKPDTLVLMARSAYETDHGVESIVFLKAACANESYANAKRVQQTVTAMIGVGDYFGGIEFLEDALKEQPAQHDTRRWLFDFYVGADDRVAAADHGQKLVLARKFDLELLKDLSNTERRRLDAEPLDQMVTRNPDDKRPLLGTAKSKFDKSEFDEAIKILSDVVESHPEHHPSQALLGQCYASSRQFDELEKWAANQSDGIQEYPGYWIALGDWAQAKSDLPVALHTYIRAARCGDPDVVQIWTRLATLLPTVTDGGDDSSATKLSVDPEVLRRVNERAKQLARFHQLKDRFERTGEISRAIALDVAEVLVQLGRYWESEAWSAIATTLPEDDSVDVDGFRSELSRRLKPGTPWRAEASLPEFGPLIAKLPLPSIERIVSKQQPVDLATGLTTGQQNPSGMHAGLQVDWKIENQARQRGLQFWGRTSPKLDQPGIMLFQTLGCGGGTIDFDLDGWSDLYLVSAGGQPPEKDSDPNELFRNVGGQFIRVAESAQTGDKGFGQGVAVGDVNEDGFADLLVLNYGPNCLYVNNGDGTFRDASDQLPQGAYDEWSSSGAIADLDSDGLADVAIVNYCEGLGPVTQTCPMKDSDVIRSCSPMLFGALNDRFLRSDGDGSFVEVNQQWGIETDSPGRGLGIIVGNLDGNLGNEVFVANDMTNNHYWSQAVGSESNATPSFSESAMLRGIGGDDRGIPQGSMGIAASDLDLDGDIDFYVTNFDSEYNTLHSQSSSGVWKDRTDASGLVESTRPLVAFGTEAIDLDNDGQSEIVVANGHVDLFSRGDEKALYDQPIQIFRRSVRQVYQPVAVASLGQYFASSHVGRSLWTVDANQDGRMDFVITHQTEPVALLVNQVPQSGNWLRLDLKGTASSRDAVGATVRIRTSQGESTAFQIAGDGYQTSNDPVLHVGLGDVLDETVAITVDWPSGRSQQISGIPTRQESVLVEN